MRKTTKKIMAIVLTAMMVLALGVGAFAADGDTATETEATTASITITSTAPSGSTADTTKYVAYEIFKADILSTGTIDATTGALAEGQTAGKVAYYIPNTDAGNALKTAITNSNSTMFTFTLSADESRWNVELASTSTTAEQIAAALNTDAIKNAALSKKEFAQTTPGGTATSGQVDPGYYLVTSSLGNKLVVQTLANVTINTKNEYIVDEKIAETASVSIGESATYFIKIYIPANIDTTKPITVHDTLATQLSFNNDVKVNIGTTDPAADATTDAAKRTAYEALTYSDLNSQMSVATSGLSDSCTFHIVINPAAVAASGDTAAVESLAGKYLVFKYTAQLLATADPDGDGYVNNEFTEYSDYKTVPSNPVVKTYDFDIKKTDGTNELTGAIFNIYPQVTTTTTDTETGDEKTTTGQGTSAIEFFAVTGGYKKADTSDTTTVDATKVTDLEAGKIKIAGLGAGTYYLVEKTAPTGFNPLTAPVIITIADDGTITATYDGTTLTNVSDLYEIVNNAGTQLPSTGGIGTTIFYIVGSVLVIGTGVVLVTRKRMSVEK